MKLDDLVTRSGAWLKGDGTDSDVVLSSRVRLARNLGPYKFLTMCAAPERKEIELYVRDRLARLEPALSLSYFSLHEMDPLDRQLLVERHLISAEHANGQGERGVAIQPQETLSIMVNEEDHLRIQVLRSGLNFENAWQQMEQVDRALEAVLPYAYHARYGYLTACPTNLGTGMRISIMLHLPAAVFSKQMEKVLSSLARLHFAVRGFYGEGTQPIGDLYQVSNQVTLGKSEADILQEMQSVVPQLITFERSWRQKLADDQPHKLRDKVWRAYGILRYAHTVTSEETLELLSALRLGCHLGMIDGVTTDILNELFLVSQPAHLQKLARQALEPTERDALRAEQIRRRLREVTN